MFHQSDGDIVLYDGNDLLRRNENGEIQKNIKIQSNKINDLPAMYQTKEGDYMYINNSVFSFLGNSILFPSLASSNIDFDKKWAQVYEQNNWAYRYGRINDLKPKISTNSHLAVGIFISDKSEVEVRNDYPAIENVYLTEVGNDGNQLRKLSDTMFSDPYGGFDYSNHKPLISPSGSIYIYGTSY